MSNPPVLQVLRPLQKAFHVGHHWRGLTRQFSTPPAALCTYLVRTGVQGRGRARVRCSTSALTEATTAGPVWRSTVGTATRGVLPPPVGACTSTLRRGGLATSRPASVPSCDRPGTGASTSRSARSAGRAQAHLRVGADAEPGATAPWTMDVPLLDAECMRIPGGPKPALVEINQGWTYELGGARVSATDEEGGDPGSDAGRQPVAVDRRLQPGGVRGVVHVAHLQKHLGDGGQVQPAEIRTNGIAVAAQVVRGGFPRGGGKGRMHRLTQPTGWAMKASLWPGTAAGRMTWKPRPLLGPPSAWIEMAAAACAALPMPARRVMHGPQPVSSSRVSTTCAPAALSRSRTRWATSKLSACSG